LNRSVKKVLSETSPKQMTSLDRKIDLSYPSNRFALVVAVVAAGVSLFLGGSWLIVASSAFLVFATWALGRELDPDHTLTAYLSSSIMVLLLAFYAPARALAFQAFCATGVLVLIARAALGTTGRALTWMDQLLIALAPIVADALSGLPLRMLGVSSLGALLARLAQNIPATRSGRLAQQAVWGLAGFSVAWLVVQTLFGINLLLPSKVMSISSESVAMALFLAALGGLGLIRRMPSSKADNGHDLRAKHFFWQRISVFVGATLTALFTPWILWFGLAIALLLSLTFDRLPRDS
jgi:hypothetical protein